MKSDACFFPEWQGKRSRSCTRATGNKKFFFLKDHQGTRMTGEHTFSLQAAVRLLEQLRKLPAPHATATKEREVLVLVLVLGLGLGSGN